MQIVLDFISGKIREETFREAWKSNEKIGEWLENLVDLKSELNPEWTNIPYNEYRMAIHKHYQGSLSRFLSASEDFKLQHPNRPKWLDIGWYFEPIAAIVVVAFPEMKPTDYYANEKDFYLSCMGNYIGGLEVESAANNLLANYPAEMGKRKRKAEAKKAIKEYFHIEGTKYPRWVQEPEWPMGTNSPMAFCSQKREGERVSFTFQDVDTQEIKVVEQFY